MGARSDWLAMCGMPLGVALPWGVKLTALGLDEGPGSARLWVRLPLLAAGALGLECVRRCVGLVRTEPGRLAIDPRTARQALRAVRVLETTLLILLPVATVLQFALLLDGHVRLRACGWQFLVHAAGAALVGASGMARTWWGSCYLRWGWAPLVAFGVPLGLPMLLAAGLVPPAIPPG
jgi:hypothetical protein